MLQGSYPMRAPVLCLLAALLTALAAVCVAPPASAKGKGDGDNPIVERFREGFKSEDAKERADAVSLLLDVSGPDKFEIIASDVIPKEEKANVLARAVMVLTRVQDDETIDEIVKAATRGKTSHRILYLECLASFSKHAGAHDALLKAVKDKDPYIRGLAAFGLGEHRSVDALEPLMALLADGNWQVQAAALDALPQLEDKIAVKDRLPDLVTYLETASGRMRQDAAYALKRITGRNLGRDPAKWRRYLAGEDVDSAGAAGPTGPYAGTKPHFYVMEVTSDRIVVLFDISLSMYDAFDIDKRKLRAESKRVLTGPADGEEGAPVERADDIRLMDWWKIKTRLDMAREQAKFIVSQLHSHQEFEFIFYSTEVEPWMGKMVKANSANKAKIYMELDEIVPDEKTNTWGALAAAFDLMDNEKRSYQKGPDELYLITDGEPSHGDIIDKEQIYDAAMQLYKVNRIKMNCIGIGVELRFMRKLCASTGGVAKFY